MGLSQEQIADAVGVHRPTVSAWERGVNQPSPRNLEDIARALGTTTDSLLAEGEFRYGKVDLPETVVRERTRSLPPRVPPVAYQLVYDHCRTLVDAGVPEDLVEEARRLMSGETFNTLHAQMADERDERGWINDVQAAWAFIRQTLEAQGFQL